METADGECDEEVASGGGLRLGDVRRGRRRKCRRTSKRGCRSKCGCGRDVGMGVDSGVRSERGEGRTVGIGSIARSVLDTEVRYPGHAGRVAPSTPRRPSLL